MKAGVFVGAGKPLAIEDRPVPEPGEGQVLLRVARSGICGSDLHMTDGKSAYQLPAGTIVGHEYAGEVVQLGPGVKQLHVGDRVAPLPSGGCGACSACLEGIPQFCSGQKPPPRFSGYAEYAVADESGSAVLADSLTWDEGALVEPLAVGLHGVHLAQLTPGDRALVIGAGPIGVAATYWLRRLGAGRIAVSATSRRRERFAVGVGADTFLDPADDVVGAATDALGGAPDVVVEAAGAPGSLATAAAACRPRGTVLVLGWCMKEDPWIPGFPLLKQLRVQFSMTYGIRDFRQVVATLATGATEPRTMVSKTVSFTELPDAFEALRGTNDDCKVMIDTTT